jgi:hypothetical protein
MFCAGALAEKRSDPIFVFVLVLVGPSPEALAIAFYSTVSPR